MAMPLLAPSPRRAARSAATTPAPAISSLFAQALACQQAGSISEAISLYNRILSIEPGVAECHVNLGVALASLGQFGPAATVYRQAITLKPDNVAAHSNLGVALANLGRLNEAVAAYCCALALDPGFVETYSNLADALRVLGRLEAAEDVGRMAIMLRPDHPRAYANLANALKGRGRLHEAESAFHSAIVLEPNCAGPYNNLSVLLKERGRLTEALPAAERAVAMAPRMPSLFINLGELRRYATGDPYMQTLEALAQDKASLSIDDQIYLHFALAKAYADTDRREDEFRQLLAGNALKRSCIAYDEAAALDRLDRIRAVFREELVSAPQITRHPAPIPIFIVGMVRSGTTLVEQLLATHPQVFGGGELDLFERALAAVRGTWNCPLEFPEMASRMSSEHFQVLGQRYLAQIKRLAPAATHITDKMPSNFAFVGAIHRSLPHAVIIHTVRNPIDTCVSGFSKLFSEGQNHTYDLAELGRYYRHYQALMAHWHRVLPRGRILDVCYEEMVADVEGAARRIVAHCGLDWDSRCLAFHRTARPVHTASATQVRQPVYRSAIGRWRAYAPFLGPLLAELSPRPHSDLRTAPLA